MKRMKVRGHALMAIALFGLLLTGCSSLKTQFIASPEVNPDVNGLASPIAISLFELSQVDAFNQASFVDLYTQPQRALGDTLLAERNLVLAPGEKRTVSLPILPGVQAIGYMAAYRVMDGVQWKCSVPVSVTFILGHPVLFSTGETQIHLGAQGMQKESQS